MSEEKKVQKEKILTNKINEISDIFKIDKAEPNLVIKNTILPNVKLVKKYNSSIKLKNLSIKTDNKQNKINHLMIDNSNNFEKKIEIFRLAMNTLKTSWTEGACTLELTRENALKESLNQFKNIDIYKVINHC